MHLWSVYKIKRNYAFSADQKFTATGLEPTTTKFVNEHSTNKPNWP